MDRLESLVKENTTDCNVEYKQRIKIDNLEVLNLRDLLIDIGKIKLELLDEKTYVTTICINKNKMNKVVVGTKIIGDELILYALSPKRNKDNLSQKAIEEVINYMAKEGYCEPIKNQKKKRLPLIFLSILFVIGIIYLGFFGKNSNNKDIVKIPHKSSKEIDENNNETTNKSKDDNLLIKDYNVLVDKYNELLEHTDISNLEGFEARKNKVEQYQNENDFKEQLGDLVSDVQMIMNITAPKQSDVEVALKKVDGIIGMKGVTESNDPNDLLGKEGGYISCVYFAVKDINQDEVEGTDIVDKGTDAGGAIEVYNTKEQAEKRIEYLSEYDDTILCSGSYLILGTMVIRTSYMLSDKMQYELTEDIVNAFIE